MLTHVELEDSFRTVNNVRQRYIEAVLFDERSQILEWVRLSVVSI